MPRKLRGWHPRQEACPRARRRRDKTPRGSRGHPENYINQERFRPRRTKQKAREISPKNCTVVHFGHIRLALTLPKCLFRVIKKQENKQIILLYISVVVVLLCMQQKDFNSEFSFLADFHTKGQRAKSVLLFALKWRENSGMHTFPNIKWKQLHLRILVTVSISLRRLPLQKERHIETK